MPNKKYYKKNREKILKEEKKRYQKNKEYIKKRVQNYKKKNPKKIKEQSKAYYDKKHLKIKDYQKEYRKNHKKKISSRYKIYRNKNKEKLIKISREYYQRNKEKIAKTNKDYYERNKEKFKLLCKIIIKKCKNCNNSFESSKQRILYCSDYCQKQSVKNRQKENYQKTKGKYSKRIKEWNKKNKEKISEYQKKYRMNNYDKIREKKKIYHKNNRNRIRFFYYNNKEKYKAHRQLPEIKSRTNERKRHMKKENKNFAIIERLRVSCRRALRNYTKTGKVMSSIKYGIDYKAIIEHLKPFPADLSLYHIDHIKPLASFNFINKDDSTNLEEIKKAFAPENHQWLKAFDNISKGSKITKQVKLII